MGESAELNNQLDQVKRLKSQLEKQANQLKTENDEMGNELKAVSGSKVENERKRKQLEMQANELQLKLQESEKICSDNADKVSKLVTELDLMSTALSEAESKKGLAVKNTEALESQLGKQMLS